MQHPSRLCVCPFVYRASTCCKILSPSIANRWACYFQVLLRLWRIVFNTGNTWWANFKSCSDTRTKCELWFKYNCWICIRFECELGCLESAVVFSWWFLYDNLQTRYVVSVSVYERQSADIVPACMYCMHVSASWSINVIQCRNTKSC